MPLSQKSLVFLSLLFPTVVLMPTANHRPYFKRLSSESFSISCVSKDFLFSFKQFIKAGIRLTLVKYIPSFLKTEFCPILELFCLCLEQNHIFKMVSGHADKSHYPVIGFVCKPPVHSFAK